MPEGDRELELLALARLGLASRLGPGSGSDSGEPLLEALVKTGALARHQARAVRAYIERFAVRCACGERALAGEKASALGCPRCGAALVKASSREGWQQLPARTLPGKGSWIGPLELLEPLGKGASGTVYRARHSVLNRMSAVKVIPLAALDRRKRARFEREIEAVGRLRHPGIVQVHAAFELGDALACEMDLIPGRTLEDLTPEGGLPWRDAALLVARIAEAVDHAHGAGVLHRDLKPANVLVRDEDGAPFVADFGLARLTDEASSLTRVGAFVGTPLYMAPEAFSGQSTEATDVYGLGAILYHALTGRAPFEAVSPEALLYRVARGMCDKTAAPGAPADLERVRAQAMAPDPDDRFATAALLASDLRRVLEGRPVKGEPRRASRRRRAILLLVALGAAGVAALALALSRASAPPAEREATPVAGTADALSILVSGEGGPARRTEALRVLSVATSIDVAMLDSAIARAPADDDLRALRIATCRRTRSPVHVDDLVRAAERPGLGAPDLLALHALRHGLRGEGAVAKLRLVRTRRPGSRDVALLLGTTACLSGDPVLRDEAAKALEDGRPGDDGPERLLLRALGEASVYAAALHAREKSRGPDAHDLAEPLERDVRTLVRDVPRAIPVVLAPIVPSARVALADGTLGDALHPELARSLLSVLAPALDRLPPAAIALYAMLRDVQRPSEVPDVAPAALARAAEATVSTDPLLAASALELAATAASEQGVASSVPNEEIHRWFDLAVSALDAFTRGPAPRSDFEHFWYLNVLRRCAAGLAAHEERLALREPDPGRARELVVSALEHQRRSFELARHELPNLSGREAGKLVRILFMLGREDECGELLSFLPQGDAVKAEARRRKGDARGALETIASAIASGGASADLVAVRALAEADLGELAEARADLARLATMDRKDGPVLDHLGTNAVAAYVGKKATGR